MQNTKRLQLTVKGIRALQEKHGIKNLLSPEEGDGAKMATLDFLVDFYYEGSRKWESAPDKEAVEDLDFRELVDAVQGFLKGDTEGK